MMPGETAQDSGLAAQQQINAVVAADHYYVTATCTGTFFSDSVDRSSFGQSVMFK